MAQSQTDAIYNRHKSERSVHSRMQARAELQRARASLSRAQRRLDRLKREIQRERRWIRKLNGDIRTKKAWLDGQPWYMQPSARREYDALAAAKGAEIVAAYRRITLNEALIGSTQSEIRAKRYSIDRLERSMSY